MTVLDKQELVEYLITKYKDKFNGDKISPIKLQKGLYFLYAFWGGKIKSQMLSSIDDIKEMTEMQFNYDEDLFDAKFEAWTYGPVDREVYIWFKNLRNDEYNEINQKTLIIVDSNVIGYIDNLIDKILNTNDLVLVDLSHEDKCWSSVYNPTKKNAMSNEAIKCEYAS